MKKTIIVTGRNGQLGSELNSLKVTFPIFNWVFIDKDDLDLLYTSHISKIFAKYNPSYFINCAAFTNSEEANVFREDAKRINCEAVDVISKNCKLFDCTLIPRSSGFVISKAYRRICNPVNKNRYFE